MKKQYEKPSMKVYELKGRSQILAGSPDPYDRDFGYMPGVNDDMNKTA
jgi:hypothetical protein